MLTLAKLERLNQLLADEPTPSPAELAVASRPRRGRRHQGAYFTPPPLVDFVVSGALAARLSRGEPRWRRDGSPELVVLDPAAGDGRFLARTADLLADRAVERGFSRERAWRAIAERCVIGIERDPEFCEIARERLGGRATIHCAEALLGAPSDLPRADVVVGNPPYIRSIRLGQSDSALWQALRGRYAATSHGEWDLYAAFIEQALEWAADPGEIGLVVSSRWLTAAFAARLRKKLADLCAVRAVVDFGAEQLFDGATTYASVVFLTRARADAVEVARLRKRSWECGQIASDSLSERPWRLSVGRTRRLLDRLSEVGPPLGELARIAKGAGTNADPIFVREGERPDIERELVRVCVRGRDVRPYGRPDPGVRVIVPYTRTGTLIPPRELRRRFPRAARYFEAHRSELEARERGRFRGDEFYRFGRPQNMAYHGSHRPKVIVPDVALRGRAMYDSRGAMVLDTAYALRPVSTHLSTEFLLAILNSRVIGLWLRETGIPLRGNYIRLKTAYLTMLPIPIETPVTRQIEQLVRRQDRPDPEELEDLVRQAYGVDTADWSE